MARACILSFLGLLVGCGGGTAPVGGFPAAPAPPAPPVAAAPQLPAVEGEILGMPGRPVPGLDATYVVTERGWLGPDDDVVFEAVIQWNATLELGCGILRRGPDGRVNTVLMQGQALPGTAGGRVKHPWLPLEARGETLILPALVEGGAIRQGLFAVPKSGGEPVLLASYGGEVVSPQGEVLGFLGALVLADGTVLAERGGAAGHAVLAIAPGSEPRVLCDGCAPGFTTDGETVVVRKDGAALRLELDGTAVPLLGPGDPAPGSAGVVTAVRDAWVRRNGDVVVHAATDDPVRPDVLVRLGAQVDVLAACGAPAPGTAGTFDVLHPAGGRNDEAFFGATIAGDPARAAAVYRARPGEAPELLAATGDAAADLPGTLLVTPRDVAAGDGGRVAFGAWVELEAGGEALGVFAAGDGAPRRILATGAPVAALANTTVAGFLYPVRDAIDAKADGRILVHVGLKETRRPDATLGALLLVR